MDIRAVNNAATSHGGRAARRVPMILTILLVLVVLALVGGGLGHSRYGYAGWSPAGVLVVIVLVLFFTGNFHR